MKRHLSYPLNITTREALKEIARGIPALMKLFYRLLRDENTPRHVKWWIGGSVLYLITPINLKFRNAKRFPFLLLNYVDDIMVVAGLVQRVFHDTPDVLLEKHWTHDMSLTDWQNLLFKIKTDVQNFI
ncbi:MAG: hypothetical protein R6V48_02375 [Fidelibacterota bacterium]